MTHKKVTDIHVRDLGLAHSGRHLKHTNPTEFTLKKLLVLPNARGIPATASAQPPMAAIGKGVQNEQIEVQQRTNWTFKAVVRIAKNKLFKGWNFMRVRKVVTRSGKRFRGKFPSQKMNKMVHWESLLERDAIFHFEYHPLVVKYQEQPSIEFYYDQHGEQHRYIPDFLVTFKDDSELLVEIKYVCDLASKKARDKYKAVAQRFEEQGRRFRIMTELDIRREPLLSNLQHIHRGGKRIAQTESEVQLAKTLAGSSHLTLANAVAQLKGLHNVLRLVRSNHLLVNLEVPLSDDSDIFLTKKEGGHHGAFRI